MGYDLSIDLTAPTPNSEQSRIEWLRTEIRQKNIELDRLFEAIKNQPNGSIKAELFTDKEKRSTKAKIRAWLDGVTTNASPELWSAVEKAVRSCEPYVDLKAPISKNGETRKQWLKAYQETKDFKPRDVFDALVNPPETLNPKRVAYLLSTNSSTIPLDEWIALKKAVRACGYKYRVKLTEPRARDGLNRAEWLKKELKNTKINLTDVFNHMVDRRPDFTVGALYKWISKRNTTEVLLDDWLSVKLAVKKLRKQREPRKQIEDKKPQKKSSYESFKLTDHYNEKGMTYGEWMRQKIDKQRLPIAVLFNRIPPMPGFTEPKLQSWYDGTTKTGNLTHWKAVETALEALEQDPN